MHTHDFRSDLSDSQSHDQAFIELYRQIYPDLVGQTPVADCYAQRHGVDRVLVLGNAKSIHVEEKLRFIDHRDFLCEEYSNFQNRTPGWTVDPSKISDYVAYANVCTGQAYYLPYPDLRRACIRNLEEWGAAYGRIRVQNQGYTTINIPVPWDVVFQAMNYPYSFNSNAGGNHPRT